MSDWTDAEDKLAHELNFRGFEMTKDDIIRMAREAGFKVGDWYVQGSTKELKSFAALVAAHEREKQAEQEPMMDYERINALREGEQNGAEDAYFFVRPENDAPTLRKMFCQGFERGFHKGLKYAVPVRTKDLTDEEIASIGSELAAKNCVSDIAFARAVIAAYKARNK